MRIGRMNKRVTIRVWQDVPSGDFDTEQTFDAGVTVWASIESTKGAVYYGAKQTGNEVTHLIVMRFSSAVSETTVTPAKVIEHAGLRYRVRRSMDAKGQGRLLHVECELLGATNA